MSSLRAALNKWTLLAAFFMLLPTLLGLYHGDRGKLAAAAAWVDDPNFSKSVLYLFDHSWYRARGLVLNRPYPNPSFLPVYLQDVAFPVYWGGPVDDRDSVFVMSICEYAKPRVSAFDDISKEIPDIVPHIEKHPECFRVFVGFAGWEAGQFELEKKNNAWRVSDFSLFVFNSELSGDEIWKRAISVSEDKKKPPIREKQRG